MAKRAIAYYGFLTVYEDGGNTILEYNGDLNTTLETIKTCFKYLYPGVNFDSILKSGTVEGLPTFLWTLTIPNAKFSALSTNDFVNSKTMGIGPNALAYPKETIKKQVDQTFDLVEETLSQVRGNLEKIFN